MRETSRMTSIARSINMHFWLKLFANLILIDAVLVVLLALAYFGFCEGKVPTGDEVLNRYFQGTYSVTTIAYAIDTQNGMTLTFPLYSIIKTLKLPAILLGCIELAILFGNLFGAKDVRKKMKPLNEIAIKAEELSNMSFDTQRFEDLQKSIKEINPENPGAKVSTADTELQSLAVAINNLLERMRESHRQQERFVSDASHELRTPIAVIQGYVNMLDRWGKDDPQVLDESIEALKNESEQMKTLVEQLLFLARGDSGRNTLHFEDFDLAQVMKDVCEESGMIDEDHKYRFSGSQQPVIAHGDISMIKQTVRILVQNAAKYSSKGDTITLGALTADGRPAYTVQDEGIGMASSEVVHVFERFYRSDTARNGNEGGTGLGLSIAKWIVDAHGGKVEILSRPDFGTRFTVKL